MWEVYSTQAPLPYYTMCGLFFHVCKSKIMKNSEKEKETEKKKNNPTAVCVLHSRYFFWFAKKISEVSLGGRGMGIFWEKPFKVKASEKKNKKEILDFKIHSTSGRVSVF